MNESEPLLPSLNVSGKQKTTKRAVAVIVVVIAAVTLAVGFGWSGNWEKGSHRVDWEALSREIEEVRVDWNTAGLAVGVVQDGKLVFGKGFGVRNEHGDSVTCDTLFAIGSTTKAFTSFTFGTLVDDGKIDWETKITNVSNVQFQDPIAHSQANFIDLMSHRTGLPRHDFLFYVAKSVNDINSKIKYLQPSKEFRESFQYNNHMFNLVGSISGKLYGSSWGKLVHERVLKPLRMTRTETDFSLLQTHKDHSRGFRTVKGKLVAYPYEGIGGLVENEEPDGSMVSSVNDLAKWVTLINNKGIHGNGTRLISEAQFSKITTPHIIVPNRTPDDYPVQLSSYGLAWTIESYRGVTSIQHGGAVEGFTTMILTFPAKNAAVIALSNANSDVSPALFLGNIVTDRVLFPEVSYDWSGIFKNKLREAEHAREEARKETIKKRKKESLPSFGLSKYEGIFTHAVYGTIQLKQFGNDHFANFAWSADLETPARITGVIGHWEYDVFGAFEMPVADYKDYEVPALLFKFQNFGVDEFLVQVEEGVDQVLFKRV
ncbi:UNVERIFIED_CONTAM: hypothetical protein HDU68_001801 [Siphonaria sp. JEL0065]|nr:hypothetical protein HDU68_001801 [Siphonaria sp. JEL0065]